MVNTLLFLVLVHFAAAFVNTLLRHLEQFEQSLANAE
jgi:hypothetical protein